jgi:hypothetical protein
MDDLVAPSPAVTEIERRVVYERLLAGTDLREADLRGITELSPSSTVPTSRGGQPCWTCGCAVGGEARPGCASVRQSRVEVFTLGALGWASKEASGWIPWWRRGRL